MKWTRCWRARAGSSNRRPPPRPATSMPCLHPRAPARGRCRQNPTLVLLRASPMFHPLQPDWLWLLALLPLALIWRGRKGSVAAVEYSSVGLARAVARNTKSRVGRLVWLLPVLGAALLIVGLARPQLAHGRTEVTANGIDIMLGLDVSGSMQAMDFRINGQRVDRIEVFKSVVSKVIDERPDDRIGLVAFAGAPYLVSPLTLDHDWLRQNLDRINIAGLDDGTAIGSAIAASVNRLRLTAAEFKG